MEIRKEELAPIERPKSLPSNTHKVPLGCGPSMYVTITTDDKKDPVEVFASVSKTGTCIHAQVNSLCRVISLGLRSGIPVKHFSKTLQHIICDKPLIGGAKSCADGIGKVLKEYVRIGGEESV